MGDIPYPRTIKDVDWLNPMSQQMLKEAVEQDQPQVELNQILYSIRQQGPWVLLQRSDGGLVPRARLRRDTILAFQFDAE